MKKITEFPLGIYMKINLLLKYKTFFFCLFTFWWQCNLSLLFYTKTLGTCTLQSHQKLAFSKDHMWPVNKTDIGIEVQVQISCTLSHSPHAQTHAHTAYFWCHCISAHSLCLFILNLSNSVALTFVQLHHGNVSQQVRKTLFMLSLKSSKSLAVPLKYWLTVRVIKNKQTQQGNLPSLKRNLAIF